MNTPARTEPEDGYKSRPAPGEEAAWNKIDVADAEQLQLYLSMFPNGFYKGFANLNLIKLGKGPKADPLSFDAYGNIPLGDEQARLDNFGAGLQSLPGAQGFIMSYGGRTSRPDAAQARADRAKDYLVNARGIDAGRLVTVDAGYKEEPTTELWIVPAGAAPPTASPTVDASEVKPAPAPRRAPTRRRRSSSGAPPA
ncbi:MAG: hypothetical protein M3348_04710 [Acidobacteriota bacterium]|nr:hypothetical protein [Acidobacteriota bacterium]